MTSDSNKYTWGDLITLEYGKPVADKDSVDGNVPVFGTNGQIGTSHLSPLCKIPSFIVGRKGAYRGVHFSNIPFSVIDTAFYALPISDVIDIKWAYYKFLTYDINRMDSGSAIPSTDRYELYRIPVTLPSIEIQKRIVSILDAIVNQIKLNTTINENLEQQAQAIFKAWFVDVTNEDRETCRADEYFDISIGKTPPRKEHQWFTNNSNDTIWVSISDMGDCGVFVEDSSEYLTEEAVKKFNINVVPANTVILSFKLTVGRVAITANKLTTNEAIAHFKTNNQAINEYLYCYLKQFNYQSLGSTSSIAVAVNSKIIKGMPFVIPTDKEISDFHNLVCPMFKEILKNQQENHHLSTLRDTLLPKLMNGEIDVSEVKI